MLCSVADIAVHHLTAFYQYTMGTFLIISSNQQGMQHLNSVLNTLNADKPGGKTLHSFWGGCSKSMPSLHYGVTCCVRVPLIPPACWAHSIPSISFLPRPVSMQDCGPCLRTSLHPINNVHSLQCYVDLPIVDFF